MSTESDNFDVRIERGPDATIVHVSGEIDLRSCPQLRGRFLELVEERPARIIVDLSGVSYVDSSGVGTIVELKRRAGRNQTKVVLVGLQERVHSVFEITRLDKFFDIANSIEEARQA